MQARRSRFRLIWAVRVFMHLVQVLATENADGTGTKFLLADVNAVGPPDVATRLILTPYTGWAPGFTATPRVEGYYIQVRLTNYGFYDNIVVTSEDAPITTYTYMQTVKSYNQYMLIRM